jgi:AbrB family looped-hinge helix DNA binding protein
MKVSGCPKDKKHMQLVRIKRAAQITLTPEIRTQFGLAEGNYLEIIATKEGILLKPVSIMVRPTNPPVGKQATKKKA